MIKFEKNLINFEHSKWKLQSRLVYCEGPKRTRLVYCKTRGAPSNATIGKVSFQSKQWIGCRPTRIKAGWIRSPKT